jgi:hypothetical protein
MRFSFEVESSELRVNYQFGSLYDMYDMYGMHDKYDKLDCGTI